MYYERRFTTPASQAKATPLVTRINISAGVIVGMAVTFPPGPQAQLHVTISHGTQQIMPVEPDTDVAWDMATVFALYHYEVRDHPFEIVVKSWNDDASRSHLVKVALNMLPFQALGLGQGEAGIIRQLGRFLFGGEGQGALR